MKTRRTRRRISQEFKIAAVRELAASPSSLNGWFHAHWRNILHHLPRSVSRSRERVVAKARMLSCSGTTGAFQQGPCRRLDHFPSSCMVSRGRAVAFQI